MQLIVAELSSEEYNEKKAGNELMCDVLLHFPIRLLDEIHPVDYWFLMKNP